MMSATIILSTMKVVRITYETKKGTAAIEPQLSAAGSHPRSGVTIASCMMPFQFSPVAERNIVSIAAGKEQKLASALRYSPQSTPPKSSIPSTA